MRKAEEFIFEIVRTSLDEDCTISDKVLKYADWNEAIKIASAHGLPAIAFDGLEKALVLRKQEIDRTKIEASCKQFGFERFLKLIDSLADVVESKVEMASLPSSYKEVMDSFFIIPSSVVKEKKSWFAKRVSLFFDIIKNRRYYSRLGYCSMERFLLSAVWAHFFDKE